MLVLMIFFGAYLAFDLARSWTDSLNRLESQAAGVLKWADKGLDATAAAMSDAAAQGDQACQGEGLQRQVFDALLNVPLERVVISTKGAPRCSWSAARGAQTSLCAATSGSTLHVARVSGETTAEAWIDPACMLAPFVLAVEDIKLSLVSTTTPWRPGEPEPTVSLRSEAWPVKVDVTTPPDWALRRWLADLPMAVALFAGFGVLLWFGPIAMLRRRISVEGQVRTALRRGDFFLTYLPTVEVDSGAWLGVEALMRWRHARLGLLQPAAFIPWIERSPLIHETTSWVLHQAAADLARMNELHGELYVGINLPPTQLGDKRVVDAALAAFGDDRLSLCRVMFELTEREAGDYASPTVQQVIAQLRGRGAQFALDDFGIGFSNLSALRLLDIDYIKVDKSFVQELERRESEPNVVDAIVLMAREFGVGIIAEGIETERQRDRIRRIGIRMAQGFLFFRPMEVEATLDQLRLRAP